MGLLKVRKLKVVKLEEYQQGRPHKNTAAYMARKIQGLAKKVASTPPFGIAERRLFMRHILRRCTEVSLHAQKMVRIFPSFFRPSLC